MLLCWDTDCTMRLYPGAVMILILSSSIWMVGTRLLACLLSAGLITERAEIDVGVLQSDSAEHLLSIEMHSSFIIEEMSTENGETFIFTRARI
jgi:hypothetical protein